MDFLFKHLSQSGKIVGFHKEEQLEIPAEALREALTNALCHRQLEKYNLSPGIAVYDDRVEIENPGRLPQGVTPENIKTSHASFPYNPLIAEVLYRSSFLESWGSGVGRMVDSCKAQGVPEPEYVVNGGFVIIVFRKPEGAGVVNGPVNGDVNGDVTSLKGVLKDIYLIVLNNPGIKIAQVAELRGKSESTVWKQLNELTKKGIIEYRGSDKTGGYYAK